MKKALLIVCASLIFSSVSAQVVMPVPYGSFEQWTTHQGYTVSGIFPMYDSYSTPTGWNHLAYPVNETISMGYYNLTVNTNVPLIVATQETGTVPDGNSAVKLQTFMISDIINPVVMTLAANYLDTTLTNMVIPSILTTGEVNVEHFMPIMTDLMSNFDSLTADTSALLSLLGNFMDMDVNYLISGGISLGDFEPSRLTGNYKYHSAVGGDNGGVVMIGTRYNTVLGKRDVVGGGVNIAITDRTEYDTFAVEYMSLHTLDASYAEQAPDSLIVLILSSASMDRQQGSWLCVDNLMLWMDTIPATEPEPDTCANITGLMLTLGIHEAVASWNADTSALGYELEYGVTGFQLGSGTLVTLDENSFTMTDLAPSTEYDIYIRSVCSDEVYGDWLMEHFFTNHDTCARIIAIMLDSSSVDFTTDQQVTGYRVSWQSSFDPAQWQVEYGFVGFEEGTGVSDIVESATYTLGSLQPDANYEFRVRTICNNDVYGEWKSIVFRTAVIPSTEDIQLSTLNYQLSISPNPAHGFCEVSLGELRDVELRLYDIDGSLIQMVKPSSPTVHLELSSQGVYLLQLVTPQGTVSRKIVNK